MRNFLPLAVDNAEYTALHYIGKGFDLFMLNYVSITIMPLMITTIIISGLYRRIPVFDCFLEGARDGLKTSVSILPALVGLMTSVAMLRASGAIDILSNISAPLLDTLNFPKELVSLALMRPVSGSGSLAIVNDLINTHGADSFIGRCASVMMGSTETTFYTIAIYFGCVGVKNTRYTLKAALLSDCVGIITSICAVRLLF